MKRGRLPTDLELRLFYDNVYSGYAGIVAGCLAAETDGFIPSKFTS